MWFIGVEVEQETSAPPPKKNPGSAPDTSVKAATTHSTDGAGCYRLSQPGVGLPVH